MGTKKGMKRKTARRAYEPKSSKKYVKSSKKYMRDMDFFKDGGGVFANIKFK